jgi:hypothetical protein
VSVRGGIRPLEEQVTQTLHDNRTQNYSRKKNKLVIDPGPQFFIGSEPDVVEATAIYPPAEICEILNILYPGQRPHLSETTSAKLSEDGQEENSNGESNKNEGEDEVGDAPVKEKRKAPSSAKQKRDRVQKILYCNLVFVALVKV